MIQYNPKDWFIALFSIHKADTFRALIPLLVFFILYSWLIVYLETEYFKLSELSAARNLTVMHTLLGFAISMLLVFRTNTAYDRWWEGRRLWGSLVNNSANIAIKIHAFLPEQRTDDHRFFAKYISLYSKTLAIHLNKNFMEYDIEGSYSFEGIEHRPNYVAYKIINRINELYKEGVFTGDQLIVLNDEMKSLTEICGGCERIKNTPIPYSYSVFIKKFIFIYVGTLPFGFAFSLGYFTLPVTTFIFYVMASLELIAEEIEDPFGLDNNDLPMMGMAQNIKNRVNEIFSKTV
ncbi:MAG: bestrophin family protein [Saprospiraceae bacterium]